MYQGQLQKTDLSLSAVAEVVQTNEPMNTKKTDGSANTRETMFD